MSTYDSRRPRGTPILAVLLPLFLLLGLVVLGVFAWRLLWPRGGAGNGLNPDAEPRPVVARGDLAAIEKANIEVYERCSPSVVHVTNLALARGSPFSLDVQKVPRGTGSGFVWDPDGHIVTNFHVVQDAQDVQVTLNDHTTYDAKEVWAYREKDIAVIFVQAPKQKLHPIELGSSHDLKVGQITYAIGNPFGLDQTLTTGIVSALGREITDEASTHPIQGVIQTSAAINPGNSGGPLLDSAGRLIGMNTAILSPSGTFAGIGFAVPVDDINQVVPQLIRHGKVLHPSLGVQFASDELAQRFGIDQGMLILKVDKDGPAAQAGLRGTRRDRQGIRLGDVVVAINGQRVNNGDDVQKLLDGLKVGDTVTVTALRDYGGDNQQRLEVKLQLQAGTD
jgi:S1-C subfamily serine protease